MAEVTLTDVLELEALDSGCECRSCFYADEDPANSPCDLCYMSTSNPDHEILFVEDDPALGGDDAVSHPSHYTSGGIECIDGIRASMTTEAFCGYCKGNCLKYIWRYKLKGGVEDLRKARVYLDWLIEAEEGNDGEH